MELTERQETILEKVIKEYIKSARPVSSQLIKKKYNLERSSATIRNEMRKLTDEGFLFQPYTSAGKVPTDKGYRLFVDRLVEKKRSEMRNSASIERMLRKERKDVFKFIICLSKFLASASSSLTMVYLLKRDLLWKEGWEEMLKEPEFEEKESITDFIEFLEDFEEGLRKFRISSGIKIYIGRENPFSKTENFSIMIFKCHFPFNDEGMLSLLGPKRMAYSRNVELINSMRRILERL